ncbi:serine/threonine-protein kinase, partial [bacterium]|nr:serine/threonine-protein kinase [bacterium]
MESLSGSTIGPYEIVGLIGSGGMGKVYRARDPRLERHVALKIISPEAIGNPHRQRRFVQEARSASALNHPNILSVYDIGTENGMQYIVSELVEGETLRKILNRGPLLLRKFLDIATQIAAGLAAAHEAGIIHRDLKPENVMITTDNRVKLLDFGLAKVVMPESGGEADATKSAFITGAGAIMGTATYMSPEQARGEEVDFRTDQFSFGSILYEMATGKTAFERDSAVQTLSAIITDEPEPIALLNSKLPNALRWQIERCLSKDRKDRYGATIDLYHELRDFWTHFSEASSFEKTLPRTTAITSRVLQRRLVQLAAVALIFVGGILTALLFAPQGGPNPASYRFTPVENSGTDADWSPDGKSIVYAANVNGVTQIFIRNFDALVPVQLTHAKTNCVRPFWSPDGTRIYYTGWREQHTSRSDLWIVSIAGGSPVLVQKGILTASISPDGKTLLSLRNTDKDQFFILSKSSPVSAQPEPYRHPIFDKKKIVTGRLQFSSDGRKVAAMVDVYGTGTELWLIDYPSGQAKQIFKSSSDYIESVSWMPDNRHAVASGSMFQSQRTQPHLWLLDLDKEKATSLTSGINWEETPAVDPQGKRIVFSITEAQHDIVEIPLDGGPLRNLIATRQIEMAPAWSPSGKYLIYESRKTGKSVIWLRNVEERWERPVVTADNFPDNSTFFFSRPCFSPDGQRIAYHRVTKIDESEIWISPIAGGTPVQVYKENRRQYCPRWSPDGNWIFYV